MKNRQPFSLVVDRFENGSAVLISPGGTVIVPRDLLPPDSREGDVLGIDLFYLRNEKKRRENIARALLDEILNSKNGRSSA